MDARACISMLLLHALIILAVCVFPGGNPDALCSAAEVSSRGYRSGGDVTMDAVSESAFSEIVLGMLEHIPPPDISICFCGEYLLRSDYGVKNLYLVSHANDLSPYVGKRIRVVGRALTGWCTGTMLGPCDYFSADKIVELRTLGREVRTWSIIKGMYR
jgi:hypothetical protein